MRFLHIVALAIVFCNLIDALKIKKPKKEPTFIQVPSEVEGGSPRYVKAPKTLTEYDKCKMECKRQRDAVNRKDVSNMNIAALREQLAALEAEEEAAAKAAEGNVPGELDDMLLLTEVTEISRMQILAHEMGNMRFMRDLTDYRAQTGTPSENASRQAELNGAFGFRICLFGGKEM